MECKYYRNLGCSIIILPDNPSNRYCYFSGLNGSFYLIYMFSGFGVVQIHTLFLRWHYCKFELDAAPDLQYLFSGLSALHFFHQFKRKEGRKNKVKQPNVISGSGSGVSDVERTSRKP